MTRSDMECGDYSSSDDVDTNDVDMQRYEASLHHQEVLSDEDGEDEYTTYTIDSDNIYLRMPSNEEIEKYTIALATRAQARSDLHLRNMVVSGNQGNPGGMFIKEKNAEGNGIKPGNKKEQIKPKEAKEMRIWAKKGSKEKVIVEATHQDLKAKYLKPTIEKIDKQADKVVP